MKSTVRWASSKYRAPVPILHTELLKAKFNFLNCCFSCVCVTYLHSIAVGEVRLPHQCQETNYQTHNCLHTCHNLLLYNHLFVVLKSTLLLPCDLLAEPPAPLPGEAVHPVTPVPPTQWELERLAARNPAYHTWNEGVINQERKHIRHVELFFSFLFSFIIIIIIIIVALLFFPNSKLTRKGKKNWPYLLWLVCQNRSPLYSAN